MDPTHQVSGQSRSVTRTVSQVYTCELPAGTYFPGARGSDAGWNWGASEEVMPCAFPCLEMALGTLLAPLGSQQYTPLDSFRLGKSFEGEG